MSLDSSVIKIHYSIEYYIRVPFGQESNSDRSPPFFVQKFGQEFKQNFSYRNPDKSSVRTSVRLPYILI